MRPLPDSETRERERGRQWSTGLGFDGLLQKACLVVGLSMPVDKPIVKCGNCDRELGESNISRLYVK
jgi:hypothetical protein